MSAAGNRGQESWVLLQVGNRRFALSAQSVVELAPPVRLHHFPQTSKLITGVIVRRGRIVPVYDIAPILTGRESSVHRFYLVALRTFGKNHFAGKLEIQGEDISVLDFEKLVGTSRTLANQPHHTEGLR
jgi:hypothetical protein